MKVNEEELLLFKHGLRAAALQLVMKRLKINILTAERFLVTELNTSNVIDFLNEKADIVMDVYTDYNRVCDDMTQDKHDYALHNARALVLGLERLEAHERTDPARSDGSDGSEEGIHSEDS